MKFLLILFILTSCALSYYYRGKDLVKTHKKNQKIITKTLNEFEKINQFDEVINQLKQSNISRNVIKETEQYLEVCRGEISKLKLTFKERENDFIALGIKKKKKYDENSKEYESIKQYINSGDGFKEKLESHHHIIKSKCGKIESYLRKNNIKVLPVSDFKKSVRKTQKKLKKQTKQNKKQISKIRIYLKKHKRKNGEGIKIHLRAIEGIQAKLKNELNKLDLILRGKDFSGKKLIVISSKSIFEKDYRQLEKVRSKYNELIKNAKAHSDKLKKLLE